MYEKQTWVSGEVVTEGKLNHMEEGIATGGGIYSVENVVYYDGEVTTADDGGVVAGDIYFDKLLPEKEIQVTFNGEEYTLPTAKGPGGQIDGWGELDDNFQHVFSNYPIYIGYREDLETNVSVYTAEAGTYSLKIEASMMSVSDDFSDSLKDSLSLPKITIIGEIENDETEQTTLDMTFAEIDRRYRNDEILFVKNTLVMGTKVNGSAFIVYALSMNNNGSAVSLITYVADSPQGYPLRQAE